MGRMFSLAGDPRAAAAAVPVPTHEDGADDAPFIEVGGPAGPVLSPSLAAAAAGAATRAPAVEPPAPAPARPAGFPRLATPVPAAPPPTAQQYLSVSFHELAAAARSAPASEGPAADLVAFHLPDHPVSGEYRSLREDVRRQLADDQAHTVFFTAAGPQSGTTTVLLNLAVTLAAGPSRVLVIDANVNRPAVSAKLGLKDAPGLAEVLAEQVPLAWAFQASAVRGVHALSAGTMTSATAAALGRDLPRLVAQARQWFDWVLVDAGVWGELPERDAACPAADAVYAVTREGDVYKPEFAGLRSWVRELGGLLRGYIATRA